MQIIYCVIIDFIFLLRCPAEHCVKGLPTENCPNCLYFNISYFPVETPFQVYSERIWKSSKCVPRGIKRVPSVFMISAGGKIDKNLTIVGFKKSYYLNILLKNPQKNPKYSKKTQKYSIFDQILNIFNLIWPFCPLNGNISLKFRRHKSSIS